jgi:hypothetical protein
MYIFNLQETDRDVDLINKEINVQENVLNIVESFMIEIMKIEDEGMNVYIHVYSSTAVFMYLYSYIHINVFLILYVYIYLCVIYMCRG